MMVVIAVLIRLRFCAAGECGSDDIDDLDGGDSGERRTRIWVAVLVFE
jgi:hypothetical protein